MSTPITIPVSGAEATAIIHHTLLLDIRKLIPDQCSEIASAETEWDQLDNHIKNLYVTAVGQVVNSSLNGSGHEKRCCSLIGWRSLEILTKQIYEYVNHPLSITQESLVSLGEQMYEVLAYDMIHNGYGSMLKPLDFSEQPKYKEYCTTEFPKLVKRTLLRVPRHFHDDGVEAFLKEAS